MSPATRIAVSALLWAGALAILVPALLKKDVPILGTGRLAVGVLLVLSMAICALSPAGAAAGQDMFKNPYGVAAAVAGVLALLIGLVVVVAGKLPFVGGPRAGILAIGALMVVSFLIARAHGLLR